MTLVETAPPRTMEQRAAEVVPAMTTMTEGGLESIRYGLIQTDISRSTALWMVALFMLGLFAVPILQIAVEAKRGERIESLDPTALTGLPLAWLAGALRRSGLPVP